MRQVPHIDANACFRPLILGHGRLARHFYHYFTQNLFIEPLIWKNARDFTVLQDGKSFAEFSKQADSIFILVSDRAIAKVSESISTSLPRFHASATQQVEGVVCIHPTMTFGPHLYSPEEYERFSLTVFKEELERAPLAHQNYISGFLKALGNPVSILPENTRTLYHAFCVLTANFPQLLWEATFSALESSNELTLSREAFHPLLKKSVENYLRDGALALTGPLVRGDSATVNRHLEALSMNPETTELFKMYQSFVALFQAQTVSQGSNDDHRTRI